MPPPGICPIKSSKLVEIKLCRGVHSPHTNAHTLLITIEQLDKPPEHTRTHTQRTRAYPPRMGITTIQVVLADCEQSDTSLSKLFISHYMPLSAKALFSFNFQGLYSFHGAMRFRGIFREL